MTARRRRVREAVPPHRAIDLVPPFVDRWRRESRSVRVICPRLGLSFSLPDEIGPARCPCGDFLNLADEIERLESEGWRQSTSLGAEAPRRAG